MTLHGMSDGLAHLFTPKVKSLTLIQYRLREKCWIIHFCYWTVGKISRSGGVAGSGNANLLFPGLGFWWIDRIFVVQSGQ